MQKTIEERLRYLEVLTKDLRNTVETQGVRLDGIIFEFRRFKEDFIKNGKDKDNNSPQ